GRIDGLYFCQFTWNDLFFTDFDHLGAQRMISERTNPAHAIDRNTELACVRLPKFFQMHHIRNKVIWIVNQFQRIHSFRRICFSYHFHDIFIGKSRRLSTNQRAHFIHLPCSSKSLRISIKREIFRASGAKSLAIPFSNFFECTDTLFASSTASWICCEGVRPKRFPINIPKMDTTRPAKKGWTAVTLSKLSVVH